MLLLLGVFLSMKVARKSYNRHRNGLFASRYEKLMVSAGVAAIVGSSQVEVIRVVVSCYSTQGNEYSL